MHVLHVSSFPLSLKSHNLHAVSIKISNGFTRNGHNVLNFSDRDIARARGFGHRRWGVGYANRLLRELCEMQHPDLLLLGHADVIQPETLHTIRRMLPALRIVQWNVDPMFESDNVKRIEAKLDVVDATLVSTAGEDLRPLLRPGKPVGFLPNPVDISIENSCNHTRDDLPYDLFYACGDPVFPPRYLFGKNRNLNEFIAELKQLCPTVSMLLGGIDKRPHFFAKTYQSMLQQAAIGLNISRRQDRFLYTSDRIAHMIGNGLAVCMERGAGYENLFTENQILFSSSIDEMAAQINMLAASPKVRRAIAAAGRARYIDLFNEKRIARYIEEVAFDRLATGTYEWPTIFAG